MNLHEGADGPAFEEPWQAQAFAMVVQLNEQGLLDWSDWAEALSAELGSPGAAADGSDYYECWLAALEKLLAAQGIVSGSQIGSVAEAWRRAAHATPHGSPILLENDPGPDGETQ
ncbi:nitrile hydratase accessory protein [Hoeflea sp. WL0058]|uniref:Nitrile hydratase accessory protein n=1 Tax=Flavimaribacter sediminis TaxID=2865987 RepID=A0AAE2ZFZ4_9HYPH|nr:nitrile hydratase accessory protein [Flavimaribacter sediminis]MBW8635839.1 nitrile hydratase accessory protein [Flavimaribacter sediminis]